MDRPARALSVGSMTLAIGLLLFCASGCRSTQSEVPPGKPYQTTGAAPSEIGLNSEPRPNPLGMSGLYGNRGPASPIQDGRGYDPSVSNVTYGVPVNEATPLGMPTNNSYGPPGTSGTDPSTRGTGTIANSLLNSMPPVSKVLAKDPDSQVPGSGGTMGGSYP
ncbi:MAG TPA: hypothetical protein VJY33_09225 [Isosphaeraceae bacterium]|nr:hypothetical protein [Isosphaeraceae bacterium]